MNTNRILTGEVCHFDESLLCNYNKMITLVIDGHLRVDVMM